MRAERVTTERLLKACRKQLLKDPATNVLPLGDLYQPLLRECTVFGVFENNNVAGVCSVFKAFRTPTVVLGKAKLEVKHVLVRKAMSEISNYFNTLCEVGDINIFEKYATILDFHPEQQMIRTLKKKNGKCSVKANQVRHTELDLLDKFYREHEAQAWSPLQFTVGPYFCVKRQDKIVSAAGVHLVTPNIAQIGNVLTDEAWRDSGFGTACTLAVAERLASDHRIISLFVRKDNSTAIHLYEHLGFRKVRDIILASMINGEPIGKL